LLRAACAFAGFQWQPTAFSPQLVANDSPRPVESTAMNQPSIVQHLERAFQLLRQGQHEQAERIGRSVLAQHPSQPDALNLVGQIEMGRRQYEKARQCFQKGLKSAPTHLQLLNNAGWVEKQLKNHKKAEAHFIRALKKEPGYYYARVNLGVLYQDQRKFAEAKRLYREVIRQVPDQVDALSNLASILEKEHQLEEAGTLALRALKIEPNNYLARQTLANIAARNQAYDRVIKLLAPLLQSRQIAPMDRASMAAKCAHAAEKLSDYKAAFALYQAANQMLYQLYEPAMQNPDRMYSPKAFKCIETTIPDFEFSRGNQESGSPVFLIGFPRSGTTLLDQVLSSHSQVTVLEEKPTLAAAFDEFPATEEGLQALQHASDDKLQKLRRLYRANLKKELGARKQTPLIVDKLPLNAFALLHINKLFPNARIIVALRDPRDCVFSGFQHTFKINPATFQLLKLDTAATFYDQVMNVISAVHDTAAFAMHFVRYESVIENFEDEVSRLAQFLGLDWEDSLFDYQETAKSRDVRTPSASQVIRPLYTSSIGKWKHYEEWIGGSFQPLEKWVRKWGYAT
jgi:tetratricopeptide (TPR) repeat protein